MRTVNRNLTLAAVLAGAMGLAALPGVSVAQQQPPAAAADIDTGQLETYAKAAVEVRKLNGEYRDQAEKVRNPDELSDLRQDTEAKMIEAIEDEGMTVASYNKITTAARSNPQLAQRIHQMMNEKALD